MKYFSRLRKEAFADFVNGAGFQITHPGPLHAPTVNVSIKRDKNLDIILESVLGDGAVSTYVAPQPGEVTMIGGTVELKSLGGMTATATGVSPLGTRRQWSKKAGAYALTERAALNAIEVDLHWGERQAYLVEWFLIRAPWFTWPEMSETKTVLNHNLIVASRTGGLDIKLETTAGEAMSWDMVTLSVEGHRVYLREAEGGKATRGRGSCMLIYCDETTPQFRTKLQECISLALGIHLVYLGHTGLSEGWDVTGIRAVRGYSINKRVFKLPPQPPSPLSAKSYQMLDGASFNKSVNAFCANYDKLHLSHLSWGYWHAMCAPAHIGAAHYGAIIEALRAAYVESNPELRQSRIITSRAVWGKVSRGLNTVLDDACLDEEALRMLRNKVSNLNNLPADRLMELVCQKLGVKLGEPEKVAWARRNRSVHGSRTGSDEYVQVVRDIKLLNIVLNRMLIAMTSASDSYIDYYSTYHPVRSIAEPVPG
jgi:hypothetical protein